MTQRSSRVNGRQLSFVRVGESSFSSGVCHPFMASVQYGQIPTFNNMILAWRIEQITDVPKMFM